MLEIVAVLVILGAMTAVAISRFTDIGARDVAVTNTLKAHLRYAQLRAMGDTEPWGIEIEADSYKLVSDNTSIPGPNLPGDDTSENDDLDVDLSPVTIRFSAARGQPIDSDNSVVSENQNINIGSNQTITITAETGFIE